MLLGSMNNHHGLHVAHACLLSRDGRLVQVPEGHIQIHSNEMLFDEDGVSTGKLFKYSFMTKFTRNQM